jgi:hypothetical protein
MNAERMLLTVAAAHAIVGLVALACTFFDAAPIISVHPALKPMKFGFSIAVFLASLAIVVPLLSASDATKTALAMVVSLTMIAEMTPIVLQPI